jgi:hypothetical protein
MHHTASMHTELARSRHAELLREAQQDRLAALAVETREAVAEVEEVRRPLLSFLRLVHSGRAVPLPSAV